MVGKLWSAFQSEEGKGHLRGQAGSVENWEEARVWQKLGRSSAFGYNGEPFPKEFWLHPLESRDFQVEGKTGCVCFVGSETDRLEKKETRRPVLRPGVNCDQGQ